MTARASVKCNKKSYRSSGLLSQQPGSPGWPQHPLAYLILIHPFLTRSFSLRGNGIGALRLVKMDLRLGLDMVPPIGADERLAISDKIRVVVRSPRRFAPRNEDFEVGRRQGLSLIMPTSRLEFLLLAA